MFKLYFAGIYKINLDSSGIGFIIQNNLNEEIFTESKYFKDYKNNDEIVYQSLYQGLLKCIELNIKNLEVYGDNNLIIKQMTGEYLNNFLNLKNINEECNNLLIFFNNIKFKQIYLAHNKLAKNLANDSLKKRNYYIKYIIWKEKLSEWLSGNYQIYPNTITKPFLFETVPINKDFLNLYEEVFIESNEFDNKIQNYSNFNEYIKNSNNEFVTSFFNENKTCKLIIPIPKLGKSFITMKDFIDNAEETQQILFWKYVAKEIIILLKTYEKIYINSNIEDNNYFHVRLKFK